MPETKNCLSENSGFTLIELLIAMVIASIVMAVIGTSYWAQAKIGREQQMVVEMQQAMRSAMYFLERDIMIAGYDNDRGLPPAATITAATANAFSFQFIDDTTNTVRPVDYILYDALGDGDADIGRRFNGNLAAIAENIQTLEFFYTLADGRQSTNPATLPGPGNTFADIRAVGVSILARSSGPVGGQLDTQVYTSLSGATTGPFNDSFKRQIVTATIKCRNMGN